MIVGELKPVKEIASSISEYKKVLVVGCGSCVTVCLSGGDREVELLSDELRLIQHYDNEPPKLETGVILKQCEADLVKSFLKIPKGVDAILSLACGAGVQTLADVYDNIPVIPALNTTFLGAIDGPGVWVEKCRGCGDCLLTYTGGICPIARCAKNLLNGPCGGTNMGKCEISSDTDCAWFLIYEKLKTLGKLDNYSKIRPAKDWSVAGSGGMRTLNRTIDVEK